MEKLAYITYSCLYVIYNMKYLLPSPSSQLGKFGKLDGLILFCTQLIIFFDHRSIRNNEKVLLLTAELHEYETLNKNAYIHYKEVPLF